jgi:hypothetical protein
MREHHIFIKFLHLPLNACKVESTVCGHERPQFIEYGDLFESCSLHRLIVETTSGGVNECAGYVLNGLLDDLANDWSRVEITNPNDCRQKSATSYTQHE